MRAKTAGFSSELATLGARTRRCVRLAVRKKWRAVHVLERAQRFAERSGFTRIPCATQMRDVLSIATREILATEAKRVTQRVDDDLIDWPVPLHRDLAQALGDRVVDFADEDVGHVHSAMQPCRG